jgi:hypothetical protein
MYKYRGAPSHIETICSVGLHLRKEHQVSLRGFLYFISRTSRWPMPIPSFLRTCIMCAVRDVERVLDNARKALKAVCSFWELFDNLLPRRRHKMLYNFYMHRAFQRGEFANVICITFAACLE